MSDRIEKLRALKPLREFTAGDRESALNHIDEPWLYEPGNLRLICSLLGAIHEETRDPEVRELVLEAVWMAKRISMKCNMRKPK